MEALQVLFGALAQKDLFKIFRIIFQTECIRILFFKAKFSIHALYKSYSYPFLIDG